MLEVLLTTLLAVTLLTPTSSFIVVHNAPRKVTKILSISNGGPYGDWEAPHFCADGSYAVGFDMKVFDDYLFNPLRLEV